MPSNRKIKIPPGMIDPDFQFSPDIPPLRIIVLHSTLGFLETLLMEAFQNAGHTVMTLDYHIEGDTIIYPEYQKNPGGFIERVMKFGPHFFITVNGQGFDPSNIILGLAESEGVPVVSWFIDTPTAFFPQMLPPSFDRHLVLCYDTTHIQIVREMGYTEVEHLPLAALMQKFPTPSDGFVPDIPVGYLGRLQTRLTTTIKPRIDEALQKAWPDQKNIIDNVYSLIDKAVDVFSQFDAPRQFVGDWFENEARKMLENPQPLFTPIPPYIAPIHYISFYINHAASAESRKNLAQTLQPLGLEVWGEPEWRAVLPEAQCHFGKKYEDIYRVYHRCKVNLSISHRQNLGSVTLRIFDVPASGSFLLTDWRPCMADLFEPGEELIAFHSLDEAKELVEKYARDDAARQQVINAARRRVLKEHTFAHRVESIAKMIQERWPDVIERPRRRKVVVPHSSPRFSGYLLTNLASKLLSVNAEKTAEPLLNAIRELENTESLIRMISAQKAYEAEDYQTSFNECLAAIQAGDHSAHAYFSAGSAILFAQGARESIPYFLKAAEIDPNSPRNWNCAGRSFLEIEDWPHAKAAIAQALGCNPFYGPAQQCWQAFSDVLQPVEADKDFSNFRLPEIPNS